jgi:hypothetical protein
MASGLPSRCPSCGGRLVVTRLECPGCGAGVTGEFEPCPACRLEGDRRMILDVFLRSRGNIREVQRVLGVSYPTARARMDEVLDDLDPGSVSGAPREEPADVLRSLRVGEIDLETALRMLEGGGPPHTPS